MSGYLLQLYEEARLSDCTKESFNGYFDSRKGHTSNLEYVTYGEFNRLEINVVDSFREFRTISKNSREWLGRRQSVLLYEISQDDKRLEYIQDSDNDIFYFKENKTGQIARQRFLVFSMLSFTNQMINQISDFSIFMKMVRRSVLKIVDQVKENTEISSDAVSIQCEVFGSFNTSEIGLFIFCNQYVDALRIIEFIRCMEIELRQGSRCKIFFHSFSFVSKNKYKEERDQNEKFNLIVSEDEIKGTAAFQISLKRGCDSDTLKNLMKKLEEPINPRNNPNSLYFSSVGEQDILAVIPAGRAMMYFQNNNGEDSNMGLFHFGNKNNIFDDVILQRHIQLLYKQKESVLHRAFLQMEKGSLIIGPEGMEKQGYIKDEKSLPKLLLPGIKDSGDIGKDGIFKKYQDIRSKMECFAESVGAVNTLDLLYTDYLSTISYTYNAIWTLDFQKQFDAILKVIDSMLGDRAEGWNWDLYRELINNFKQQIYHLSQSNRTFLEFPTCHIRYTGQQDYLLHAYFGIIKKILQIVYLTHERNTQSELIPLITVDVVPIVNSTLHYEGKNSTEARVMNLNIPNDIMFDFPRGAYYLVHELYHYVAPYDRLHRNKLLTCIMLTEIILRQVNRTFESMLRNEIIGLDRDLKKQIDEGLHDFMSYIVLYLRDIVWKYIDENYNSISQKIEELSDGTTGEPLVSSQLFLSLIKYTEQNRDGDILVHFERVFKKCFEILEYSSKGFEYKSFISEINSGSRGNLEDEGYEILLNILQYYYADKKALDYFLEKFCYNGYIFSGTPKENEGEVLQDIEWVYRQMWHGFNEAVRDVAMITIMDISLSEYLIFVLQCWFDLQPGDSSADISEEQKCRLGSIFMYYFHKYEFKNKDKKAEDYRDSQKELFIQRYVMIRYENFKDNKITWEELFIKAESRWDDLYESFNDYRKKYSYYDVYIQEMFSNMDIEKEMERLEESEKGIEVLQELKLLCGEFKSKVTETYNKANHHFAEVFDYSVLGNRLIGEDCPENMAIKEKAFVYKKEIFECNLNIAHYFQKQNEISSLYDKCQEWTERQPHKENHLHLPIIDKKRKIPIWEYTIYDQKKLISFIQILSEKLEPGSDINYNSLWYRGETDAGRKITPALFREFEGNIGFGKRYKSMRRFIEQAVEEFRFRADGSNAFPDCLKYTSVDYVTLLQHYGVNTHFLDWSEDAVAALYFALEKYLNQERLNGKKTPYRSIQIMIFDPKKYNSIRSMLFKEFLSGNDCVLEYQKNLGARIPNLSITENQSMFGEFLPFLSREMKFTVKDRNFRLSRLRYLPIAIWTSKLNDRLNAQNGGFVAFNLETPLDICKRISLENIQKEVLEHWGDGCFGNDYESPVFLYIVKIDKTVCLDMAKCLRAIGMSTERLYPELNNIGKRINHRDLPLDSESIYTAH